ncbi:MAG: porin family protein [Pseudomonadota bacterium]
MTDIALVQLIATGQLDAARAAFEARGPTETDWLFFEGRVAKARGDFSAAAHLFREVLRRTPTYIAARRELAHTLLLAGEYRASAHHFQALLRSDPDVRHHDGYQQFLNKIDQLRPFSVSGTFAIISSSNVNRGSSQDVFRPGIPDLPPLTITSGADAATGIALGLSVRRLWAMGNGARWALHGGLVMRDFPGRSNDTRSVSARISYGQNRPDLRWSLGPSARLRWSDTDSESLVLGIDAGVERRLGPDRSLFISGSLRHTDVDAGNTTDGYQVQAAGGINTAAFGGVLSIGLRASLDRPQTAHFQYDGLSGFAQISQAWSGGFSGALGLEIGGRSYRENFPLASEERQDRFAHVSVSVRHAALRIGRFSPALDCTFGRTASNIAFYDYDLAECSISFSIAF